MNELNVGSVLDRAAKMYGQFWQPMLGLALIVNVPAAIVTGFGETMQAQPGYWFLAAPLLLVSMIAGTIVSGMYVKLVEDIRDGRMDGTLGGYFAATTPRFLPLIGTSLLG